MAVQGARAIVLWMLVWAGATLPIGSQARGMETVTLASRRLATTSPAAPFERFLSDAQRRAASTTVAWTDDQSDLSAWGPALIFSLLDESVSEGLVRDLAMPLEAVAPAGTLLSRTVGLYAAKARLPFSATPSLMGAIDRNLGLLQRATRDLGSFTTSAHLSDWGTTGTAAWVAYLDLQHRDFGDLGAPGATAWNAEGLRILNQVLLPRALPQDQGFGCEPEDRQVRVWPTALMIYALTKAYENEEAVKYESAAIAAAAALEALRADDGSYSSSPERSGTDARANAFLAGALLLLWKDNGEPLYRQRAIGILRWLTSAASAAVVERDAALAAHVGYLVLLLDSLATRPYENILGRRPMRMKTGGPALPKVDEMLGRLRPADFRYRELFDAVFQTLTARAPYAAGDFAYDYGDAPGYAGSVLFRAGATSLALPIVEREEARLTWPRPRDFDEIAFGTSALFAALDHAPAAETGAAARALRRYLLFSGGLAAADWFYLDWLDALTSGGGYDYGPTVLGAQIAATHLEYAERFPDQRVGWWLRPLQVGRALIDGADAAAWNAERHVYRARAGSDDVWVLPNAMMILNLLQAHRITGEAAYRSRAEAVARGLEMLWDEEHQAYFASSVDMGDHAYQSLSTNSYAALALLRLYETTHDSAYRARALAVFDFMRRDLYANGVIYHHLFRGRRATGDIWCVGCNWRVLAELMELAAVSD